MNESFDLQEYLSRGIENFVADVVKATLKNPRESAFMLKFAAATAAASKKRREAEAQGLHIPSFLIASITSQCNLHCAGCYSRCNHATLDETPVQQLTDAEWLRVFSEADELGISFILLAGGEPMLRRDIIEAAGKRQNILFPIFTNGTFIDKRYFELFDKCRNLVPILSIEGEKEITDLRRGKGIYDLLIQNMDELHRRDLIFGASITVTTENIQEVTSDVFLKKLSDRGCKAVIYVEFVPVTDESRELAPGDAEREYLQAELKRRRERTRRWYMFPSRAMRRAPAAAWQLDAASSTSTPTAVRSPAPSLPIRISMSGIPPWRRLSTPASSARCGRTAICWRITRAAAFCMKNATW